MIDSTPHAGDLPAGWDVASFGELNSFSGRTVNPATRPDEVFELYSVPSFPAGRPEQLPGRAIGSTKLAVSPGDVLVCKINPRINRVWKVGPRGDHEQIASSEWIGFRSDALLPRFAQHYFSEPSFRSLLCSEVSGVGGSLTRAQPSRVAEYPVPVAPLAEQTRIADQLDTLLSRIQACQDRLDAIPALLKRFRTRVLSSALSGELTEDWRSEQGIGKETWSAKTISEVAEVGTGSTPLRSNNSFYAETGTPWVTSAATSRPFIESADQYVTKAAIAAHRLKIYRPGTLIIAMYGEGKTRGQVSELRIDATINQACAAITVDPLKADTAFVKLALSAQYEQTRALAEGGAQPNLNLSKVRGIPLHMPTGPEQAEIVLRVGDLFALADSIESRVAAAAGKTRRLPSITLAKAFRGELVPQDPNDEPAAVLLSRIAAERNAPTSISRPRSPGAGRPPRAPREIAAMTKSRQDDDVMGQPYLAGHLRRIGTPTSAEALFEVAELPVADFYKQLAWEVAQGHVKDNQTTLEPGHAAG